MDQLEVGLIDSDQLAKPEEVLKILDARQQSAIVVRFPDSMKLVYRGALIEMIYRHTDQIDPRKLHDMEEDENVAYALVENWKVRGEVVDTGMFQTLSVETRAGGQEDEDSGGIQYAVNSLSPTGVAITTRFERLGYLIKTTGGFRCTGMETHGFPDPEVKVGDPCPEFGCVNADGSDSEIVAV